MNIATEISDFYGHNKISFTVNGRDSFVVCPKNPLRGNPWAWRTEFFGAFDYPDRALLEKGWYLAYHKVSDMYGCPESITMMKEFYDVAVNSLSLSPYPSLFGFSRGGLYAVNFAAAYPECVGSLYLDAPVTDIKSWPGGLGKGEGCEDCWKACKKLYEIESDKEADIIVIPNDYAEKLSKADIPVIIVAGDSDITVPYDENGKVFAENFRYANPKAPIKIIIKHNCGHHPHSMENPVFIIDFIIEYTKGRKDNV